MSAYYNDNDAYCCAWLRNLIAANLIPAGEVDSRPIQEVQPSDLTGFTQVHLFAGLGGWAYATRLAGWPDDRPLWTGSCPCQPFSVAGKRQGVADERHLWPHFYRLIRACRPPVVMGEQVSGATGYAWLDGVRSDLETEGYACRAVDIPACAVGAPHRRNRLYWVADRLGAGLARPEGEREDDGAERPPAERGGRDGGGVVYSHNAQRRPDQPGGHHDNGAETGRRQGDRDAERSGVPGFWDSWELVGPDPQGKYRRVKPGVLLLAHGVPARVAKLRALGNAIVPQLAAEVIRAWMGTRTGAREQVEACTIPV
jgi:DNA (cytosine-5)-methyltransferase 1